MRVHARINVEKNRNALRTYSAWLTDRRRTRCLFDILLQWRSLFLPQWFFQKWQFHKIVVLSSDSEIRKNGTAVQSGDVFVFPFLVSCSCSSFRVPRSARDLMGVVNSDDNDDVLFVCLVLLFSFSCSVCLSSVRLVPCSRVPSACLSVYLSVCLSVCLLFVFLLFILFILFILSHIVQYRHETDAFRTMYHPVAIVDKTDNVKIYTILSLEKWVFCVQSSIFIRVIDYKGRIKGRQNALKSKIDGTIYCA